MNLSDTIVAVSSPEGAGERAVLRLSGADALRIADHVFVAADLSRPSAWPTYRAGAGRLEPPGAGLSVPAVLYVMRAPRSYTREDVAEFHVGAWPAVTAALVAGLMRAGARAGEPGEFTLRALVGGRLDLAQAEAVMAVVGAANEAALRAAGDLLRGHLSAEVARVADEVREILVLVEADLDFSDQGIEAAPPEELARRIGAARAALANLGRRSRSLETFGGEVRLVIAGRPNAGKSTLFNRLLADAAGAGPDADRAIVAPEAGTTRDELRAALRVGDLAFVLSDTAGLDETADELAGKARGRALEAIGRADLVLVAMDATAPSHDWMAEVIGVVTSPMVLVITKCDLAPPDAARRWLAARGVQAEVVATSAVTGRGLADLCDALVRAVEGGGVDRQAAGPVVTARHRAALEAAVVALARAARVARRPRGAGELVAMELRESLDALATVTGRRADTDVLDAIFSRFCIGK